MTSSLGSNGGLDLWTTPAAPPPAGVVPNFIDPSTLEQTTLGCVITVMTISTVLVLYSTSCRLKKLKLHDYTVLLALILMYGFAGLVFALLPWARHQWNLPLARLTVYWQKVLLASEWFLSPTILVAKLGILLMYLQVFAPIKAARIAIYIGIAFNFLIYLPNFGITGALCSPAPGEHFTTALNIRCARSTIWGVIQGTLSVFDDLYILILPIPVLLGLNMKRPKKIALITIFGTALLGLTASIVGLVYRVFLWRNITIDITWNVAVVYICMMVEVNVAIIVSVMPSCAGLAKSHFGQESSVYKWWHSRLSSITRSRSSKQSDSSSEKSGPLGNAHTFLSAGHNHQRLGSAPNSDYDVSHKSASYQVRSTSAAEAPVAAGMPSGGIVRNFEVQHTYQYV